MSWGWEIGVGGIQKVCRELESLDINLKLSVAKMVGNGRDTSFGSDRWVSGES